MAVSAREAAFKSCMLFDTTTKQHCYSATESTSSSNQHQSHAASTVIYQNLAEATNDAV